MEQLDLLSDIYSAHRAFLMANERFAEYSFPDFVENARALNSTSDDTNIDQVIPDIQLAVTKVTPLASNFYPSFLIQDDLFAVMRYHFAVSRVVHDLREQRTAYDIHVRCIVIPERTVLLYDSSIEHECSILNVTEYLEEKTVDKYQCRVFSKQTANEYVEVSELVNSESVDAETGNIVVLVDRRDPKQTQQDKLYVFECDDISRFEELHKNYFFGMQFKICAGGTVRAWLHYGDAQRIRFTQRCSCPSSQGCLPGPLARSIMRF